MDRRTFLEGVAAAACGTAVWARGLDVFAEETRPAVAVTMDDFFFNETPLLSPAERNRRILAALDAHAVHAAAFVVGRNAETDANRALLAEWTKAGHLLGNHTYSHPSYEDTSFAAFSADILAAENVLERIPGYSRWFRFPYLKEGASAEQRDRMRGFLRERGYRIGHVTIDASDWYVDSRLRERLKTKPDAELAPYRDFYLDHMWARAMYYDGLAREAVGRTVPHTMLIHFNLLNALFLGDLLSMFAAKGWRLVDAKTAFADPFFVSEPKTVPAGESLVWATAKETGKHAAPLRYPAEDGEYEKPKMDALGL